MKQTMQKKSTADSAFAIRGLINSFPELLPFFSPPHPREIEIIVNDVPKLYDRSLLEQYKGHKRER